MYYSFIYFNILTVFYSYLMFIIPLRLYIVLVGKKKKNHLSKSIKAKQYFIAGIFFFFLCEFAKGLAWSPDLLCISANQAFGIYYVFLCATALKCFSAFPRYLLRASSAISQLPPMADAPMSSTNESWRVKTCHCVIVWHPRESCADVELSQTQTCI